MSYNVLLISETYLRQNSFIGGNVQNEALTSSIKTAQETVLKPIIGKALYDHILDEVYNAGGSFSGLSNDELILVEDYCIPVLLTAAINASIPKLMWKATNKGIVKNLDQYSEGIDLETIKYIRNEVKNEMEQHIKRLQNYLCDNNTLFPEYNIVLDDENPDTRIGYSSGIYFRRGNRNNSRNPFVNGQVNDNPQNII